MRPDFVLFNETAGTFIVEVENEKVAKKLFSNVPFKILGNTTTERDFVVMRGKKQILRGSISSLKTAWQKPMKEYFNL